MLVLLNVALVAVFLTGCYSIIKDSLDWFRESDVQVNPETGEIE